MDPGDIEHRRTDASTPGVENPTRPSASKLRVRHADGSWRWIEATWTNQLDEPAVAGHRRQLPRHHRPQADRRMRASSETTCARARAPRGAGARDAAHPPRGGRGVPGRRRRLVRLVDPDTRTLRASPRPPCRCRTCERSTTARRPIDASSDATHSRLVSATIVARQDVARARRRAAGARARVRARSLLVVPDPRPRERRSLGYLGVYPRTHAHPALGRVRGAGPRPRSGVTRARPRRAHRAARVPRAPRHAHRAARTVRWRVDRLDTRSSRCPTSGPMVARCCSSTSTASRS